ncbi:phosphate/phosphite/phosphonate ABC transporter substrate-binding protein [Bacillus shivajii]|uniref:phosphate/phosphite/phosphonate ABC transporter substrate-binding protein n=1 Tax=Bacillus shivajii TaxID=1983719 RepID=UPI001CF9792A|nr:phosphate/phosphite/phosphonate ABC transporter substrate-binding protein [Bacillus shivajii]UCZ52448.1 phosphate/phosphite/phosphonate ABC transporter substrate-binding protein [Bacillus shivajii]
MRRLGLLSIILTVFIIVTGCGDADESSALEANDDIFEVAVIPAQSIGEMQTGLDRLEEELANKLGREVSVEHYPSYNAVVEAINYSHIDLAYLGPLTYLIAHENSGAQAILTQLIDGEPYYYSYMISHIDQPWETLDEALDNPGPGEIDFAFGSISSTSGSLIPGTELVERGVFEDENNHEFASVRYTGSHDITAQLVENQTVEIGAIDSAIYDALVADGAVDVDLIQVIWQSEKLYQYPWVVPHDMDEELIKKVQQAFISIEDEAILNIFGGADAFIEIDDEQYEDVLEAAREFNMLDPETLD